MHRELVPKIVPAPRGLDGVNIADKVGNCHIRSRKLLDVAIIRSQVVDRGGVPLLGDKLAAAPTQRRVGIVVDLASTDEWSLRIEQASKCTQDAALCLASESQQDEIVF